MGSLRIEIGQVQENNQGMKNTIRPVEIDLIKETYRLEDISGKIKDVNISNAEHKAINDMQDSSVSDAIGQQNLLEFYEESALNTLFFLINQCIGNGNINSVFIEWSSRLSTVGHNKYIVFTGIMQNKEAPINIELLKYLFPYNFITDKQFPLYYHKDFFCEPKDGIVAHLTRIKDARFIELTDNGKMLNIKPGISEYYSEFEKLYHTITQQIKTDKAEDVNYHKIRVADAPEHMEYLAADYSFPLTEKEFQEELDTIKQDIQNNNHPPTVDETHKKWHTLWHQLCGTPEDKRPTSYFLSIPIVGTLNKKSNKKNDTFFGQGACSIFIHSKGNIPNAKFKRLSKLVDIFLKKVTYNYAFEVGRELAEKLLEQAIRAAISQVFIRCGAHNIGAHVMNNLTDAKKLSEFNVCDFTNYSKDNVLSEDNKQLYTQIALYNSYVKGRLDYLSDITFGTPVMHTNKKVHGEIFKELDKVRLLLEHISGLSDFPYKIEFAYTNKLGKFEILTDGNDIPIAVPNDLLGCHAFYNILENIIRNTAKHNQNKPDNNEGAKQITVFTVNIREVTDEDIKYINLSEKETPLDTLYIVEVYDNLSIPGRKEWREEEESERDAYFKTCNRSVVEKISNIDWVVDNQNIKINTSLLQADYSLRSYALGMIEMESSAAYLRKKDITNIEADEYKIDYDDRIYNKSGRLNILKAFAAGYGKDCLGYRFFVYRPTELLIISEVLPANKEALLKVGIEIKTETEFKEDLDKGVVYNHQFVLYSEQEIDVLLHKYKTALPVRWLKINTKKIANLIPKNFVFADIEEYVWNEWWQKIKANYIDIKVATEFDSDLSNETYQIDFVQHGEEAVWKPAVENYRKDCCFLEPLSSNAQKKLPNWGTCRDLTMYCNINKTPLRLTKVIKNKIFEAATNKVVAVDERIQKFSQGSYDGTGNKIPYSVIHDYTNIVLPKFSEIQLDAANYNAGLIKSIEIFILENAPSAKFLLIHYSILERMYATDRIKISEVLTDWADKNPDTRIIITSGRGKPPGLPDIKVCYVNLSPVLNVFNEVPSKYSINYLLNAARK